MMPFRTPMLAGASAAAFLATNYGALMSIANDSSTVRSQTGGAATTYPFLCYDKQGWKVDTATLQVPNNSEIQLLRLLGSQHTSSVAQTYDFRKWNGAAYAQITDGRGQMRPNRSGSNTETSFSAILPAVAGDKYQLWNESSTLNAVNGGSRNWYGIEVIPKDTKYTFAIRDGTNQTFSANVKTNIQFTGADIVDLLNCHSPTVNADQFVIQAGTTGVVRVTAFATAGAANTGTLNLKVALNGVDVAYAASNEGSGTPAVTVASRILRVVAGDIITVSVQLSAGTSIGGNAWCCVEELSATHRYCIASLGSNQSIGSGTDIPWDGVDIWDPENLHDPVTNNTKIFFPSDAREFRCTYGVTASTAGLTYNNSAQAYFGGYAAAANGRTVFNSMGAWNTIVSQTFEVVQGFGLVTANGGVGTTFYQIEFR